MREAFSTAARVNRSKLAILLLLASPLFWLGVSEWGPSVEEVRSMTNQGDLAEAVLKAHGKKARREAIRLLTDVRCLTQLIENDDLSRGVRRHLKERLRDVADRTTDPDDIRFCSEKAPLVSIRLAAVAKLSDMKVLSELASDDPVKRIRELARDRTYEVVQTTEDNKTLWLTARDYRFPEDVRRTAVRWLSDHDLLMDIALRVPCRPVFREAIEVIQAGTDWGPSLLDVSRRAFLSDNRDLARQTLCRKISQAYDSESVARALVLLFDPPSRFADQEEELRTCAFQRLTRLNTEFNHVF